MVMEHLKTKEEASPDDVLEDFATTQAQLDAQGGGFSLRRFRSGQVKRLYVWQSAFDRRQVYKAKDANKVSDPKGFVCF